MKNVYCTGVVVRSKGKLITRFILPMTILNNRKEEEMLIIEETSFRLHVVNQGVGYGHTVQNLSPEVICNLEVTYEFCGHPVKEEDLELVGFKRRKQ